MNAKKVMVVDDERIVAEDIMECLRAMGCDVCGTAKSGVEAIEKADELRPDLILMDIVLQGDMDGVEAARVIRGEFGIPVVFLSAYSDPGVLERAKQLCPLGYIVKPFEEAGLRTTVEVALHRIAMDETVRDGGDWFATTLRSIGDGVVATDLGGRVSFMNPAAERLCGRTAAAAVEEPISRVLEFDEMEARDRLQAVGAALASAPERVESELGGDATIIGSEGTRVAIRLTPALIHGGDGEVAGAVFVLRDVTEERKAKLRDQQQRERLESVVNERTGELVRSNKRLVNEIEERKRAEMALNYRMGMQKLVGTVMARFLQMKRDEWSGALCGALEAVGEFLEVDATYLIVFDGKTGEAEIESEWRGLGSAVAIGGCRDVDAAGLQVLGGWRERVTGVDSVIISRAESEDGSLGSVARARSARSVVLLPMMSESGVSGFIGADSHDERNWTREDATVLRMVGDVMQAALKRQRQAEENEGLMTQLYQSQKMEAIGKLSGGIAHDFNNMLQPIIGYSDLLLQGLDDGESMYSELQEIRRSAERAASLTRQMLTFSRKQVTKKVEVDLNVHVADARNMLARIIGEEYELELALPNEGAIALADAGQVEQVLMNLVVNARDAMPGGGVIGIATGRADGTQGEIHWLGGNRAEGRYAWFSVTDQGAGMDTAMRDKVFEPFFSTKGSEGTGLGLSVVYGIVEQHQGGIWIETEPGEGTTFTVYLPEVRKREEGVAETQRPEIDTAGRGERILLIEDEQAVIQFVSQALRQRGYDVVTAMTVREARDVFLREEGAFDMFFSDAVLPDGNGVALLDELLNEKPGTPALLSSGYTDKNSLIELAKEKELTFLQKPYALPVLFRTVREVIEQRAPEAVLD